MTLLQRAQAELYRSSSRRFDVELCLIRLCDRRLSETEEGILSRLSRLEEQLSQGSIPIQQEKIVSPPEENASSKEPIPAEETPPWVPVSPQEEGGDVCLFGGGCAPLGGRWTFLWPIRCAGSASRRKDGQREKNADGE